MNYKGVEIEYGHVIKHAIYLNYQFAKCSTICLLLDFDRYNYLAYCRTRARIISLINIHTCSVYYKKVQQAAR